MTAAGLAAAWLTLGAAASLLLRDPRVRRLAWLAPAVGALLTVLTARVVVAPGPLASVQDVSALVLGRQAVGLLVAATAALALAQVMAPRLDGGEALGACAVAAGCVLLLGATVPLAFGVGAVVAMGSVALRWISAAPSPASLWSARVGLVGACALLGAAPFMPPAGPAVDQRTALAGGLLAGGVSALLGLLPLGGWAAGALASVRAVDLALWPLLMAPATLLAIHGLAPSLQTGSRIPVENVLLVLGLLSAAYASVQAARAPAGTRYGRLLIADLALAAAGVGSTHAEGFTGALILVLAHLVAAPLMLHPARPGLATQRRLAWFALLGIPPSPLFWGRLLILGALSATNPDALFAAMVPVALLLVAAVRGLSATSSRELETGTVAPAALRGVAWVLVLGVVTLGFLPLAAVRAVFGEV